MKRLPPRPRTDVADSRRTCECRFTYFQNQVNIICNFLEIAVSKVDGSDNTSAQTLADAQTLASEQILLIGRILVDFQDDAVARTPVTVPGHHVPTSDVQERVASFIEVGRAYLDLPPYYAHLHVVTCRILSGPFHVVSDGPFLFMRCTLWRVHIMQRWLE